MKSQLATEVDTSPTFSGEQKTRNAVKFVQTDFISWALETYRLKRHSNREEFCNIEGPGAKQVFST